jgi:hypothetical protein
MKYLTPVLIVILLTSCADSTKQSSGIVKVDTLAEKLFAAEEYLSDTIPPDGTYRFDVAFAEWEGKSMGEKVTVVIKGDSIKVVYEGDGNLTSAKKGDVFSEGILVKHKTGVWIIGKSKSDAKVGEIGGCLGGPTTIDFKYRKYWMC